MDTAVEALTQLTNEAPLLPYEVRALAERSTGNPLFLEELWRARVGGASMDALPDSIDTAVTAQIDRLPPGDRQTLRCAAVLGTTFLHRDLLDLLRPEADASDDESVGWGRPADSSAGSRIFWLQTDLAWSGSVRRSSANVPTRSCLTGAGASCTAAQARRWRRVSGLTQTLRRKFFRSISSMQRGISQAWHFARVAGERARDKYANIDAATHFASALAAARRIPDLPGDEVASVWEALGDARDRAGAIRGGGARLPQGASSPNE